MEKQKTEHPKSNLRIVVILLIAIVIVSSGIILVGGCTILDPCERKYTSCVHDCGEGILSDLCKEKCTYDRNQCK